MSVTADNLNRGQQVCCDRAFEHEGIRAGVHRRAAHALFVVNA
jgi:hypothetical protein